MTARFRQGDKDRENDYDAYGKVMIEHPDDFRSIEADDRRPVWCYP